MRRISVFFVCLLVFVCSSAKKNVKSADGSQKRNGHNKNEKMKRHAIVPSKKMPVGIQTLKAISNIKNSLLKSADLAIYSANTVKRKLKSFVSSDYESLLLKMTNPDV